MIIITLLQDIIIEHGYIFIFFCLALGIIGLPIPDEILMVTVGYLCSLGLLYFPLSLSVSVFGAMTGMLCSYALGRKLGKPLLWKYGKWIRLTTKRLEKTESWFEHYGPWAICIGYYIPGLRHLSLGEMNEAMHRITDSMEGQAEMSVQLRESIQRFNL